MVPLDHAGSATRAGPCLGCYPRNAWIRNWLRSGVVNPEKRRQYHLFAVAQQAVRPFLLPNGGENLSDGHREKDSLACEIRILTHCRRRVKMPACCSDQTGGTMSTSFPNSVQESIHFPQQFGLLAPSICLMCIATLSHDIRCLTASNPIWSWACLRLYWRHDRAEATGDS